MAFLFRLLSRLPLPLLHNLGALFGWLHWLASPVYRRHMRENMALAGVGDAWSGAIAEAGKTIFELPKLWARPHAEVVGRVARVTGWDHVEEAVARGRGIVFLTPHLGCFEITAQYIATAMPLTVLYRRSKHAWLAPIMEAGRSRSLTTALLGETGAGKEVFAERLHYGAGYHVRFQPLSTPLSGDLAARAARINHELEALIRQWPEQYLWG